MANFNVVVSDPCWSFSDRLTMSPTKRGAESQYSVLTDQDIINLDIKSIVADDAVLALWVPSSKLAVGLKAMEAWGFDQTQTFIWVKTKNEPLKELTKSIKDNIKTGFSLINSEESKTKQIKSICEKALTSISEFDLNECLNFFMGRLFRQTHEIALIGKRGNIYTKLQNKSQRSVLFDVSLKHSAKPEGLQDRLEIMFPGQDIKKIELFARRERPGWVTVGNDDNLSLPEDIRDSIERLKKS